MQRLTIYFFSLFLIFQSSLLSYSSNPADFVNELVNDAITKLSDKNISKEKNFFC